MIPALEPARLWARAMPNRPDPTVKITEAYVTFPKGQTPPAHGFWSLSIYNEHHFFVANQINRFSVGTKSKDLVYDADGSLTIHVQAEAPKDAAARKNWLPAPAGAFSLYIRTYWPKVTAIDGSWTPPPVQVV